MRLNRTSPPRTNHNTPERSRPPEDSPRGAPANPANADDQNALENPPAARTDQTEAQGGSLAGDGETSHPASSMHATATNPADLLSAGQTLPPLFDREHFRAAFREPPMGCVSGSYPNLASAQSVAVAGPRHAPFQSHVVSSRLLQRAEDETLRPASPVPTTAANPMGSLAAAEPPRGRASSSATGRVALQQRLPQAFAYEMGGQRSAHSFDLGLNPLRRPLNQANANDAGQGLRSYVQRFSNDVASPSAAVLSEALHLGQGFCESPEWQHLAKTQDLALLSDLVTTALRTTKNPNLKAMLRRLVEEMVRKPALAERVFVVLVGADESCGDRVSLALSRAEEELLAQPVWEGSPNDNLPEVIKIARQVFRRRFIEELAKQKVEDINKINRAANEPEHTEDVETLLALLAGLHGPLELGGEKPDAQFTDSSISGVTREDIEIAERKVLEHEGDQEGKRLWDFIATWEPWQRVILPARLPDEVAWMEDVLGDPDRPARLQQEAEAAVENANVPREFRQDAITRTANQIGQDEARQLWLAITKEAWRNR